MEKKVSERQFKKSVYERKSFRVRNFIITSCDYGAESNHLPFVRVSDLSGSWSVSFSQSSEMYLFMNFCLGREEMKDYLSSILTLWYTVTNSAWEDTEFMDDVCDAVISFQERLIERAPKATEEDDEKAINDMKTNDLLQSALNQKDKKEK